MASPRAVGTVLLCLIVAAYSNLKVKQPASDSTPPSLVWNVFNHATSAQVDYPGSPTINAKRGTATGSR